MTTDRHLTRRDRSLGALVGLVVGDALGVPNEMAHLSAPPFPKLATGPVTGMIGGGPFALKPGQVTDDSHMAIMLATSLWEFGAFKIDDVAQRYVEWAFGPAFDVGGTTRNALGLVRQGIPPIEAGLHYWRHSGRSAAGNGSLMRTAPIGVFFADDPKGRRLASIKDSMITHADPRCVIACCAFNAAIAAAIMSEGEVDREALLAAADCEIDEAVQCLINFPSVIGNAAVDPRHLTGAAADLHRDLLRAQHDDPLLAGEELDLNRQAGFVRVAFRGAFWTLLHAPTFEAGLIEVVNRYSDSDTVGATTGALVGATLGEQGISAQWKDVVFKALRDGPSSPLRDDFHPRRLIDLLPA